MDAAPLIINGYGKLYNRDHLPNILLTPIRRFYRFLARKIIPLEYNKNKIHLSAKKHILDRRVIVSLTSFPPRMPLLWLVIESLKRQSIQPDKIILWLSEEQFDSIDSLPTKLRDEIDDVFEIRFVSGDVRSHKKYLYSFIEYHHDYVITVDDDIIYPSDMIESLIMEKKKSPKDIICRYGFKMTYTKDEIDPFSKWIEDYKLGESDFCFGSGGGTLFVPSELYPDVVNIELAQQLAPLADDLWLNAMCLLAGLHVRVISRDLLLPVKNDNDVRLCTENVGANKNDLQLRNIIDYYIKTIGVNPFAKQNC